MIRFKVLTIYRYWDGLMWFTAQSVDNEEIYFFRMAGEDLYPDGPRTYKADGYDITVREDELDRSEATS